MKTPSSQAEHDFIKRHIGSNERELSAILKALQASSLEELTEQIIPEEIYKKASFHFSPPLSETEMLEKAKQMGDKNQIFKSYIGQGYNPCITPGVIARNILGNPAWYTSYTPYQPELAQGRLQALLNFQTMVADLTGMEIANSSLLDEGTAAAEGLALAKNANEQNPQARKFFVDQFVFPQTVQVLKTRAKHFKWELEQGDLESFSGGKDYFAALIQYPNSQGNIANVEPFLKKMADQGIKTVVAADLLSLCLLKPPGEMGADVVVGSSQRFGVPLFFGGPHAAFFATRNKYARLIPGRIVGLSKDRHNQPALRLALQTREQHIRRERATSNICTSQVLLALMAGFYAVYHGPEGLKKIARKVHHFTEELRKILQNFEGEVLTETFFDTLQWKTNSAEKIYQAFLKNKINLGRPAPDTLSWTLNELTEEKDLQEIFEILKSCAAPASGKTNKEASSQKTPESIPTVYKRTSPFLTHPVFNSFHSETQMLRYIHQLQKKELSLTHSMIPLGSCTMKLNATAEMLPVTWAIFSHIHPFAPKEQSQGYAQLIQELEKQLCEITGFSAFSFQPNAGSQGEYAGLITIKNYHESRGEGHRNICLIPVSAHGTNPASAHMAGLKTVPLACTKEGSIDQKDLDKKLETYGDSLSSIMITYPSTYGVFEEGIPEICQKVHNKGGRVYLDGANMNALLGLCKPRSLGFDVCHLNLHKTFCIPHGGGGPGAGPVGVSEELKPFLPAETSGAVSSAPFGSAGILIISWAYIAMMGYEGLKQSAQVAMAHANYIAEKLKPYYRILFTGPNNRVAHECIVDFRKFKNAADITVEDVAKRLMDYSFHAPTMSWPVPGTLMIEPTESESKEELDKFCDSLIAIKKELEAASAKDSGKKALLKNAPHTLEDLMNKEWAFPYEKNEAFYPLLWIKERKFWPPVSRVENAFGDINLFCSCPPLEMDT
ncbi:MAG: aminomethyl-transferring glycine dehydrogenase [Bdellovibrionales bacterium]|nr:aminomethyl-transferring glycine dehydrogenase [Bdellovibrionales bacterium]